MHIPGPLFEINLKKLKKQLPFRPAPPTHPSSFGIWNFLVSKNLMKLNFFFPLDKTPLGETGCLSNLYYLLAAQAFSFLIYHVFQKIVSYATPRTLHLNVQPLYHFWDAIPGHWSPNGCHPTLPRKAEDFPRCGKYPRETPLLTFLTYFQPA